MSRNGFMYLVMVVSLLTTLAIVVNACTVDGAALSGVITSAGEATASVLDAKARHDQ